MLRLPSAELLEARHSFPCPYVFKVIGKASNTFTARVVAEVRTELKLEQDPPYHCRTARNGGHISVTLEPTCASAQEVIALYARLSGLDELVMLL
jgi:putative lipoic acid-binding regulatory protein